ncbi:MAG: transglutaminase family protein [Verrucomicrobiales bacterium]|nr:transglutaminase family protein [Verrucomicrobiales bacterium]
MRYQILHRTRYLYAAPVRESFNEVRLKPVTNADQTVESFLLKVLPACPLRHYEDFYANWIHHFEIPEVHSTLLIEANTRVSTHSRSLALDATPASMERLAECARMERCFDYLLPTRYVDLDPATWRLALDITAGQTDIWQSAVALMRWVYGNVSYTPQSTTVHTRMSEVLSLRQGVCQDLAHVLIGLCRSIKIPALYVSGYLATERASATHAWIEVFLPGVGWQPLDPTHNGTADDTYVKIAVGRDYADVTPVRGHYKGTQDRRMEVEVSIQPLDPA